MRALACTALLLGGCTLIFDGSDLRGIPRNSDGGNADYCTVKPGPPGLMLKLGMPTGFPAGMGVNDIVRADFDGDGIQDFATSNPDGNDVTVAYGTGPTTFGVPQHFATGAYPLALAVGDLNGDGQPDLVVACSDALDSVYKMSVLVNAGGRSFHPHSDYGTDANPFSVALADFDKDGNLDAAVSSDGTNFIDIFKGHGDGTFAAKTTVDDCPSCTATMSSSNPYSVLAQDLDGDGAPDLVAIDETNWDVAVLHNDGTGKFTVHNYTVGRTPHYAAIADVNGDMQPDIVVSAVDANDIEVLLNQGGATFGAPTAYDVGTYLNTQGMMDIKDVEGVAVADLNLDGNVDLIGFELNTGKVGVFLGRGGGTFATTPVEFAASTGNDTVPVQGIVADVDGDCRPDLLIANRVQGSGNVSLLLNQSQ
jgi:hypothetical protein